MPLESWHSKLALPLCVFIALVFRSIELSPLPMLLPKMSGSSRTVFRPQEIALLVRYILIGFPSWVKRTAWYVSASVVVAVCMFVATFVARHVSVKVTFH